MSKDYHYTILLLLFTLKMSSQKMTREDYINKYYSLAVEEMNRYKIPASITLAQGLLETENGNSDLCVKAKNHFGIKCKSEWTGPIFIKDDDTKNECFRSYSSDEESYRDHSLFLLKPRYSRLFTHDITDYRSWAYGLKEAGYATNPKYPQILIQFIEELKLFQFDNYGYSNTNSASKPQETTKKPTIDIALETPLRKKLANQLELVIVNDKFDIYSLATVSKKSISDLMEYNDIHSDQSLRVGQNFFLQKKKDINPDTKKHIALLGESLYDISQIYGVSLKSLRKMNKLEVWENPKVGEEIYLNVSRDDFIKTRPFYEIERERQEKSLKLFIPIILNEVQNGENSKKTDSIKLKNEPLVNTTIIENKENETPTPEKKIETLSTGKNWVNHTIKPKETLFRISKIYDCKPNEILEWNGITLEQGLKNGQVIRVFTAYPQGKKVESNKLDGNSDEVTSYNSISQKENKSKHKPTSSSKPIVKSDTTKINPSLRVEKVKMSDLFNDLQRAKDSSNKSQPKKIMLNVE